jgi:hypothetical protein
MATIGSKGYTLPHDPLTPLDPTKRPTVFTIQLLKQELHTNAQAVESTLGGGGHGHLGMLMTDAKYLAASAQLVPYVFPVLPPPLVLAGNSLNREQQKQQHKQSTDQYNDARLLQTQLRNQIIQAVPPVYIAKLKNGELGLANITPKAILEHLTTNYGTIKPQDLANNLVRLSAPWNPDEPIETVFTTGDECRRFATLGEEPIADGPYIRILVDIFTTSGVLDDAVKDWKKLKPEDRDLATCIDHFSRANETRTETMGTMRDVLAALPAIGARTLPPLPRNRNYPPNNGSLDGFYYCWTHGISQHPGTDCFTPASGHITTATLKNRQGGSIDLVLGAFREDPQGTYVRPTDQGGRDPRGGRGRGRNRNRGQDAKKRKAQEDT